MITLANLAQATAQEVFNQVKEHLLKQGKPCKTEDNNCSYRNLEGLKCAAGCLISDEEYLPTMDVDEDDLGSNWNSLIKKELVPSTKHNALITSLQILHDNHSPEDWEGELEKLAFEYELEA